MRFSVSPIETFSKTLTFPGDKSISHRAVMLGAIAQGKTEIRNFLLAEDCLHTLAAFKKLGVKTTFQGKGALFLQGKGLYGLHPPHGPIYLGNSGTSMRLLSGILAGQPFTATLTGDPSLSQRPMERIIDPLERMGANVVGRRKQFPPLTIRGGMLQGIRYRLPVASAQVKSAILLAGLYAEGTTTVIEPLKTRDHTERMLRSFGKPLTLRGPSVSLEGGEELRGTKIEVPGDISSAAFFIVLASIVKGAQLTVRNVGLNPTRLGFIEILRKMGARITLHPKKGTIGEPAGDIVVHGGALHGITLRPSEIPGVIDELPVLMVAGACAHGRTLFQEASELRVKETDRIHSMVANLRRMGIAIQSEKDDILIEGGRPFYGAVVESFKDHRTAMSLVIAGCLARQGKTTVRDVACIQTSFPGFIKFIDTLCR